MGDINTALNASNDAIQQLLLAGERTRTAWTSPRAPGKWSPSQIVEHVARSLEESANMAASRPSKFPKLSRSRSPHRPGPPVQAGAEEGGVPKGEDEQGDESRERARDACRGTRSP